MNIRRRLKTHAEVHTGPLNDILFILLMFFLIASTLANPNVIKLSNPKAKGDTKTKQNVVVNIDLKKHYIINGNQVDITGLKAYLQPMIMKDSSNATIAINADKQVPVDEVVAVMRVARELGARTVLMVDKAGVQ
ncbi:MAG: biopolymer transporter ExbD [Chitinophagaceae bacterium]|nr:biopolymer transporter ExbD [Chitinophagaceae bacterium]